MDLMDKIDLYLNEKQKRDITSKELKEKLKPIITALTNIASDLPMDEIYLKIKQAITNSIMAVSNDMMKPLYMELDNVVVNKPKNVTFDKAFKMFIEYAQNIIDKDEKKNGKAYGKTLSFTNGKKYIKIIQEPKMGSGKSVWAFINKTNGDILKPANWNTPAKHARGNIFDPNYKKSISTYGPAYLR